MSIGPSESDPGLQPERTTLAWRRTGLALVVGALLVGRLGLEHVGVAVAVPAGIAAALAVWVLAVTLRGGRYAWDRPDHPGFGGTVTDGRLPALVTALVSVLALGELLNALAQVAT